MNRRIPGEADIIFDWNQHHSRPRPTHAFELFDETLRDGLQSPSVTTPSIDDRLELLRLMSRLGIAGADVGLPAASPRALEEVVALSRAVASEGLPLQLACAARTLSSDVAAVVEAVQRSGRPLVLYTFIGSSPIRQWVEAWDAAFVQRSALDAIDLAVKEGLEVAFVTEDTTRSPPGVLEPLFRAALEHGAQRLVLCDTVGHATPDGTAALVRWTRELVDQVAPGAQVDWHGHNDRGIAVANAITALEAGAHRAHGCGLGIGERIGNVSMDQLLVNLKLLGWYDRDLTALVPYARKVSEACRFPIADNYPLVGRDAFRTTAGIHAAAIIKAQKKGDAWLADRVYSAVPAGEFGKSQRIDVGPMSGMSNVRYWLELHQLPAPEPLCQAILDRAKSRSQTLSDDEILEVVREYDAGARAPPGG